MGINRLSLNFGLALPHNSVYYTMFLLTTEMQAGMHLSQLSHVLEATTICS